MDSGRNWFCFIFGVCSITPPQASAALENPTSNGDPLNILFQWKQLEFDYLTPSDRERDIKSGAFAEGTFVPLDVDVYYSAQHSNNRIFISIPKFGPGVPATFGTVTNSLYDGNPIIKPFPSWSWHQNASECRPDRLVSVFRSIIDECDRLWVLDSGTIGFHQICNPQIVVFNPETSEVIHRYDFPPTVLSQVSLLVTPVVDVRNANEGCSDTFVYVADIRGFAIIVYDVKNARSWKVVDKSMYPDPSYGTYSIQGDSFDMMDGIVGLSLSPYRPGKDRRLFFHAMSSTTETWVYTSKLRNSSLFPSNSSLSPQLFHTYHQHRKTQSAAEAIDSHGILYFGLLSNVQIACWNIDTEYGPRQFDIVASNVTTLQFPSGIKIIKNQEGIEELWIMTSRFQKFANGSLNPNETNFRILAGRVDDLLLGKKCKRK